MWIGYLQKCNNVGSALGPDLHPDHYYAKQMTEDPYKLVQSNANKTRSIWSKTITLSAEWPFFIIIPVQESQYYAQSFSNFLFSFVFTDTYIMKPFTVVVAFCCILHKCKPFRITVRRVYYIILKYYLLVEIFFAINRKLFFLVKNHGLNNLHFIILLYILAVFMN